MAQPKGHTGNPNGRPKGTPNRATAEIRAFILDVLSKNRTQIKKDLKAVEPNQRLQFYEKLLQYAVPKQTQTAVQIDERLTDDQINMIINQLAENLDNEN